MADPLSVTCPDCQAPPDVQCRGHYGTHADRRRTADLRHLDRGTCALCGRPMVKGSVEDAPVDAWHPDPADAKACPVLPDPATDWEAYAVQINAGRSPGHPGIEHFRTLDEQIDALHGPGASAALDAAYADGSVFRAREDRDTDAAGVPLADDPPGTWERGDYEGGDPDPRSYAQRERDALTEDGRRLASQRDDLIAAGADPADLEVPDAPDALLAVTPALSVPIRLMPARCPECRDGKPQNCAGQALDPVTDTLVPCPGGTP